MYRLQVFYPDQTTARETLNVERAPDVLTAIPNLIGQHAGCAQVVIFAGATRLFAVDCVGNRLPD